MDDFAEWERELSSDIAPPPTVDPRVPNFIKGLEVLRSFGEAQPSVSERVKEYYHRLDEIRRSLDES